MDELTVDTLREAPRFVRECLSEFKIRCEHFDRGCGFIELGKLERHIDECGYAPVVCSNDECELEVNKRDLIHHETAVCEHRRVKCHNCGEMRQELNKVNEKLDKMEVKFTQLNETLKQINANLAAQNVKLNRLETLEATVRSLERREINYEKKKEYNDRTIIFDEIDATPGQIIASGRKKKGKGPGKMAKPFEVPHFNYLADGTVFD
jgi:hypothetical protein